MVQDCREPYFFLDFCSKVLVQHYPMKYESHIYNFKMSSHVKKMKFTDALLNAVY